MSDLMKVCLYSPEKPLAELKSGYVQVPGLLGYMGILPGHTAMIAELGVGELRIETDSVEGKHSYFVSGGYVEVLDDEIKVLVDTVEHRDEIDIERARAAELRAEKRLTDRTDLAVDIGRALAALERAKARRKLAEAVDTQSRH